MKWQPIETAPKDGTSILVYPPTWKTKRAAIAKWNPNRYAKNPKGYWERDDDMQRVTISRGATPTHWMPLPEPPEEV